MKPIKKISLAFLTALSVLTTLATGNSFAQTYPTKSIRLIVPFPPGGGGDSAARLVADYLSKRLNQAVIVDNKGGADQVIGTTALTQANPDGYTLMLTGSTMVVHAAYGRKLPYNPMTDIAPIAKIATVPVLLLANPGLGVKNVNELLRLAKSRPGEIKAAHIGTSGLHYFSFKLMEQLAGIDFLEVPYKGSGPAVQAALSGEVGLVFGSVGSGVQMADSGKLVALGVTGASRSAIAPHIPTLAEAGLPGFALFTEFYVYAPAATPPAVIAKLNGETRSIIEDPAVRKRLEQLGFEPETGTTAQAVAEHRTRYELYRNLIKTMNLTWDE
jgi:tripartite-type tricarboxylate transporter receptor subunit TctC